VVRRTNFELKEAEKRAHILEGYIIALDHLDEVISLIRSSKTPDEARDGLMNNFKLSEIQAKAILEMRLQRLTGLERDKIKEEYAEVMELIKRLKEILDNESIRMQIIKDELLEIQLKYGDERRTDIVHASGDLSIEDMIESEDMVITISHQGYIKRTSLTEYRVQARGGRGSMGSQSKEEDFIEHIFVANTHNYLLLFTEQGQCFWLKVYEIPEGSKASKGRAIQNILNIGKDDKVRAYINVKNLKDEEYLNNNFIIMCTKKGIIKKTTLEAYSRPRANGINAITVRDGDQLLEARLTNGKCDIMMAIKSGRAIRFQEDTVRPMGRTASGVRGINIDHSKDEVVGMITVDNKEESILVLSEKGYGKRSEIEDYRITNRGGKGVKTINVTDKTGNLVGMKNVSDTDDLMIINKSGITIRLAVNSMRVMGRATQGVRLINLKDGDEIASLAKIDAVEEQNSTDISEDENNNN
jgi:DNA gyrase subunit A